MRSLLFSVLLALAFAVLLCLPAQAEYGITAKSYSPSYEPGGTVIIIVSVPAESDIAVQVTNPEGETILIEGAPSENGTVTISFVLDKNASEGKYRFYASSVSLDGEEDAMTTGHFQVKKGEVDKFEIPLPDPALAAGVGVVIAGVFLGATHVYEPWKYRLWSLLIPLYTRIGPKEIDKSEKRGEIMGYLRMNPGANFSTVKKDLGYGNGQLAHHLRMLENARRIKSRNNGTKKLFFPRDYKIPNGYHLSPAARSLQKEILDILTHSPSLNQKELAEILEKDRKTVAYHLNKLVKNGMLRVEKRGREKLYTVIEGTSPPSQPVAQGYDSFRPPRKQT